MNLKRTLLGIVLTSVVAVSAFMLIGDVDRHDISETGRLRNQLETLGQLNRGLESENQRLGRTLHALETNPAVMEQAAREDFGYIKDGEIVLVFPE